MLRKCIHPSSALQLLAMPIRQIMGVSRVWLLIILLAILLPSGCSSSHTEPSGHPPLIRVKLLSSVDQALVTASEPPIVRAASDAGAHVMSLWPKQQQVQIVLAADGRWRIGGVMAGEGE